jgi:hypothetical protein
MSAESLVAIYLLPPMIEQSVPMEREAIITGWPHFSEL